MSCKCGSFALHLFGELVAQLLEVNPAQVDELGIHLVVARLLGADGLVDDR
jgi:hypothetical protein